MKAWERAGEVEDNLTGDQYETASALAAAMNDDAEYRAIHDLNRSTAVVEVRINDAETNGGWVKIGTFTGEYDAEDATAFCDHVDQSKFRAVFEPAYERYTIERYVGCEE